MASKVSIALAGAIALSLCFLTMSDVPHNTAIRNPQPMITILWTMIALIVVAGVVAFVRSSRNAITVSFVASGLGILVSVILACV
jgi:hypothetical protein